MGVLYCLHCLYYLHCWMQIGDTLGDTVEVLLSQLLRPDEGRRLHPRLLGCRSDHRSPEASVYRREAAAVACL
jgi:hypothetical protein